ncbi:MAG: DotD/TraH family lipoprotein [Rhodobacteraceae bacterium]|nr:DotD/TraH family lipoprotein [Paracoccaceae bacterium]
MRIFLFRPAWLIVAICIPGLAACSATVDHAIKPDDTAIDAIIAEAAAQSASASEAVAMVEKHAAGLQQVPDMPGPDATDPVRIDWQGPVEPLLDRLAAHMNYQWRSAGQPPANPVIVTVAAFNGAPLHAIPKLDAALYGHATIRAVPSRRMLVLDYGN